MVSVQFPYNLYGLIFWTVKKLLSRMSFRSYIHVLSRNVPYGDLREHNVTDWGITITMTNDAGCYGNLNVQRKEGQSMSRHRCRHGSRFLPWAGFENVELKSPAKSPAKPKMSSSSVSSLKKTMSKFVRRRKSHSAGSASVRYVYRYKNVQKHRHS